MKRNGYKPWKASEIKTLKTLWLDRAWSLADIAAEFGRSKKGIATQAHQNHFGRRPFNTYTKIWPEHLNQLCASMWKQGRSSGEIAAAIGVTRSAVMGKVHRLGLIKSHPHTDGRRRPTTSTERCRKFRAKHGKAFQFTREARKVAPLLSASRVREAVDCPPPLNLSLIENTGCMWPTEKGFCGHPRAGHKHKPHYCEAHCHA